MRKVIPALLATLALGVLMGRWSGVPPDPPGEGRSAGSGSPATASVRERPRSSRPARTSRLDSEVVQTSGASEVGDIIGPLARRSGLPVPDQDLFTSEDAAVSVLQLSDREQAALQSHWRAARDRIRLAELADAKIANADDGAVTIDVTPVVAQRDEVRRKFVAQAVETLGQEKGEAFIAIKGGERLLAGPETDRHYRIAMEDAGAGNWRFRIEQQAGEVRKVWIADAIPAELEHLTDAAGLARRVHDPATEAAAE